MLYWKSLVVRASGLYNKRYKNIYMTITIQKSVLLTATLLAAVAFSVPFTSFAYTNLQIEVEFDDGRIEVDVDHDEAGQEIELELVFNTTDLDEAYRLTAEELDLTVAEVEAAVVSITRDGVAEVVTTTAVDATEPVAVVEEVEVVAVTTSVDTPAEESAERVTMQQQIISLLQQIVALLQLR